jgi:hypothetical protein
MPDRFGFRLLGTTAIMLTEFDQSTLANMTAALEYVCKRIPPEKDTPHLRKRIGATMIECANLGKRTFADFQNAGTDALAEALRPPKFDWFGLSRLFRRR